MPSVVCKTYALCCKLVKRDPRCCQPEPPVRTGREKVSPLQPSSHLQSYRSQSSPILSVQVASSLENDLIIIQGSYCSPTQDLLWGERQQLPSLLSDTSSSLTPIGVQSIPTNCGGAFGVDGYALPSALTRKC